MNAKRFCSRFLALFLLCGMLSGAAAESPESQAASDFYVSYTQGGFLYEPGDGSAVYFYDCGSGQRRPLCTRAGCEHRLPEEISLDGFHYSAGEFMNGTSSLCYAARLAYAANFNACVTYGGKVYFFPLFYINPRPGTCTLPLYVSEENGETRLLTDLGSLYSGAYDPFAEEALAYDGYLYYDIFLYESMPQEGQEAIPADPGLPAGSIQLVRCAMDTGEVSVLETFSAESNEFHFMGVYDGVLYYLIQTADGLSPAEDEMEYRKDVRSKSRYSVYGVNVTTGEKIVPDRRLCDRTLAYGERFDIVKDGILYSIVLPETAEDNTALFLGYDLNRRETVLEYPFEYIETEYYPYRVLTDEIMLTHNFEDGIFALRNLKTGEIRPLDIPAARVSGNAGETEWYDIFNMYFQTDPLVLDHCFPETGVDKAYITAEELLGDNPRMHKFADK